MYEYQSTPMNVVDGDTVDVKIDLGFRIHREIRLRLAGVDTREIHGVRRDSEEYRQGIIEKEFVEEWFRVAEADGGEWPIVIRSEKTGKYGRYIAEVERQSDGAILNDDLVAEFGKEIRYPQKNLRSIRGIGPVRVERLREAGICDLKDLSERDFDGVADIAGVSGELASEWIAYADQLLAR